MYSKINQIRYELEKLYESSGLSNEVLKVSRQLDKDINEIQKKLNKKYFYMQLK
ncbi:Spo0E family sporulation regulatory protein-aspartic acid phosphatase [Clostridium nigeriense]|uniref:Spo0E family sporulation regulatory protein-aspartic acid phosphatase n=1 Tax=Clostridium nigeriense TaxID=1805470 RepID=UPI003D3424B1